METANKYMANNESKAIFAAGCFWGVEEAFRTLPGVIRTRVGYTGGSVKNPTYEMVSSHTTGHAEALEVTYDPQKISYENLLAKFWQIHDPTQIGGQGPDVGNQYRSEIFYLDQAQREAAQKSQQAEQLKYKKPIATQLTPAGPFYAAEEYHQHYVLKTGKKVC